MSMTRNTLTNFVGQMLTLLFSAVSVVVISRTLGPSGRGAYSLIILAPYVLLVLGNLGISYANVYYLGKGARIESVFINSIVLAFFFGVLLAGLFSIWLGYFQKLFFRGIPISGLVLSIWTTPFIILIFYCSYILLVKDIQRFNIVNVLLTALPLAGLPIFLFGFRMGLMGVVISYAVGMLGTAMVSVLFVRKYALLRLRFFDIKLLWQSIAFGVKAYLFYLTQFLNSRLDLLLVAYFLPLAQVGFYSIATSIFEAVGRVPAAIALALFPAISSMEGKRRDQLTAKACRHTLFIILICLLVLFFSARFLILSIFGMRFAPVLAPLWWLFPGMVSAGLYNVLLHDLTGRGRPEMGAYASLVSLFFTVGLDLFLIPRYGITGAAIASSMAYTCGAVLMVVFFYKNSTVTFLEILLIRRQDFLTYRRVYLGIRARALRFVGIVES